MKNIVVGLGEILWDVFPERKVLGGAPANFAYHASQFGFNGYAVSAIGDDLLGKEILTSLEEKGLNYLLEKTDYPTGTVQVTLNKAGVPQYEICENVAWDNIPFTARTENLAKNTQTVCFGSLAQRNSVSRETIRKFITAMPEDSLKIFDINLRLNFYSKEIIHESLEMSNMMKINDEEVLKVANLYGWKGDEQEICGRLLEDYKLDILVLTKGTDGSFVFTPRQTSYQPTPKVHVADTVGAGDSFTAAFVAAYLHGERIEDAHQLAVEVSAYVCLQHGAMPKLADSYLELFRK
ncbi:MULTISPECIES: carbohydrate kinase family protein [unclassified Dysgonomonas]|uniref:carbohydrate kinase family protein n=1 Tax=unclassified Dysgonomonas TaxID=2630389 RepID=UPI0006830119|nr:MULTISPECIES: carbohydrate kinase [unclassified Dysgonomonas]MBD8347255.1 carbohydrate kinase [Dysgonomonas sp. HGC4]MBF0575014.1 carbohydrate kinase [Dysgonomonas sp. GY617]